jgi:similar to stage IV sporulation protein
MLIWRLWNYIQGYVIIVVEGYFLEKFINICTHRQLRLWNVKWYSNSRLAMKISIRDYRMLRPVARKSRCRVHIAQKKGLPFVIYRYKNRKAFIMGAAVFIVAFFIISSFIWDVSVTGNDKVSTETILEKLYENGIKPGALKYKINPDDVVDNMMLDIDELSRISVSVRGTRIFVNVSERVKPPDLIDKSKPCDLVALKDGVIYSIVAKEGLETVKVGDTVTKGQLLVTGTIENVKNPEAPPLMVHSMGTVKARTWYEASTEVEQTLVKTRRTGAQKDTYSLVLFTKKFKLFHRKIPYNNSEHVEVKKKLSIGKNFVLPMEWVVDRYYEYELEQEKLEIDKAKELAAEKALKLIEEQIPKGAQIAKKNVYYIQKDDGSITANITVECIEDIGVTQMIGG